MSRSAESTMGAAGSDSTGSDSPGSHPPRPDHPPPVPPRPGPPRPAPHRPGPPRLGLPRLGLPRLGLHRLGPHRLGLHRLVTHGTVPGAPPLVVEFVGAVSWLLHHVDSFWAAGREVSASAGTRPLDLSAPGSGRLACWSCSPRSLSKRSR